MSRNVFQLSVHGVLLCGLSMPLLAHAEAKEQKCELYSDKYKVTNFQAMSAVGYMDNRCFGGSEYLNSLAEVVRVEKGFAGIAKKGTEVKIFGWWDLGSPTGVMIWQIHQGGIYMTLNERGLLLGSERRHWLFKIAGQHPNISLKDSARFCWKLVSEDKQPFDYPLQSNHTNDKIDTNDLLERAVAQARKMGVKTANVEELKQYLDTLLDGVNATEMSDMDALEKRKKQLVADPELFKNNKRIVAEYKASDERDKRLNEQSMAESKARSEKEVAEIQSRMEALERRYEKERQQVSRLDNIVSGAAAVLSAAATYTEARSSGASKDDAIRAAADHVSGNAAGASGQGVTSANKAPSSAMNIDQKKDQIDRSSKKGRPINTPILDSLVFNIYTKRAESK